MVFYTACYCDSPGHGMRQAAHGAEWCEDMLLATLLPQPSTVAGVLVRSLGFT